VLLSQPGGHVEEANTQHGSVQETESALVMMGDQKTQLEDRIKTFEEPLKME
jgi:hypothetical protein